MKDILLTVNNESIFTAIWSSTKKHSCFHKDRCTYFPEKQVYPIRNPCNFLMIWNVIGKYICSASQFYHPIEQQPPRSLKEIASLTKF